MASDDRERFYYRQVGETSSYYGIYAIYGTATGEVERLQEDACHPPYKTIARVAELNGAT